MNKKGVWIIAIMLSLIVIINIANYFKAKPNPQKDHHSHDGHLHRIPDFQAQSINGRVIQGSDFQGKNVYIQFAQARESEDRVLFSQVYTDFKDEGLEFVLFTDDSVKTLKNLDIDQDRVHIIDKDYEQFRRLFGSAKNIGSYFLFDGSGNKVDSGKNAQGYENGPKLKLNELLWNESFNITEFIDHTASLDSLDWLKQIKEITQPPRNKLHLFYLSVRLCEPCGGGAIVERLKRLSSKYRGMIEITAISYTNYTDKDIKALRSQSGVKFPIIFAQGRLLEKWDSMIRRFNQSSLDNIIFTTDSSGKIYNIMFKGCKCFNDFFAATEQLIKERNT